MANVVVPAVVEVIRLSIVGFGLIASVIGSDLQATTSPLEVGDDDDDDDKEEWSGSIGEGKGEEKPSLLILLELSSIDLLLFVRVFCSRLLRLSSEEGGKTATTRLLGVEPREIAGGGKEDDNAAGRCCCWWSCCCEDDACEGEVQCMAGSVCLGEGSSPLQGIEFSEKREDDAAATLEPLFPVLEFVCRSTFPRRTTHAGSKSTPSTVKELEREGEEDKTDSGGRAVVALSGGDNGEQVCANDDDEGEDSNRGEGSKGLLSAKEGIEGKEK